jgi:hypothetical protein
MSVPSLLAAAEPSSSRIRDEVLEGGIGNSLHPGA